MDSNETSTAYLENGTISYPWTVPYLLKVLDISFRNQLTEESPKATQPPQILVPLRDHQKALVHAMLEREKASVNGVSFQNTITYSNYGVLGDEVGSGKSLVILAYIAMLKNLNFSIEKKSILLPNSRNNFFSIYTKTYPKINGSSLIVVPHSIYRQWQLYIQKQTTLTAFFCKSEKDLAPLVESSYMATEEQKAKNEAARAECIAKIQGADVVLVSNTLYGVLQVLTREYKIGWKRIFLDEADTIYIPSTNDSLDAPFVWFVTATWPNLILNGQTMRPSLLVTYNQSPTSYTPALGDFLRAEIGTSTHPYGGRTTILRVRSQKWLDSYKTDHVLRGMTLLTNSKEFLEKSRQMPQIQENTILCLQPASHRAVAGIVNANIQGMIHAGNIEGALAELGVTEDTTMNLVDAVTKEREKELDRLQKTLAFKSSMDYSTPHAKEVALASLQSKIISVETQLKTFRERITATQTEECPICYDDPTKNSGTITPCCHRIFCGGCILQSLSRGLSCPMCRSTIQTNQLIQIVDESKVKAKDAKKKDDGLRLLTKPRQLLKFLKETPEARVLVFSRYENPFVALERDCEGEGIAYHTLRGNKDVIASTIRSFEQGEKRVLFLPTQSMGAGINLVSATHIVLLHAMTPEEEKQAVGRAYRLGRTQPLQVVRLLHEGETIQN
jgi:SNF2 family DNA or RNA helicase